MEIYEALEARLLAQSGLTALIGDRIYPDDADEGAQTPYVVYRNISDVKDHHYGGQDNLESPIYQFTVYADTKLQASAVAKQIKSAFYRRESEITGLKVQYIKLINELSTTYTQREADNSFIICAHDLEFEIHFERS